MEYGFSSFMIDKVPPPFVNEVRIGNWISSYMAFMDDKEFSHKEIRKVQVDGELMKYLIDNPLATFKGIPLSSDILEKCGFIKDRNGYHLPGTQLSLTNKLYPCWLDKMLWPQDIPEFQNLSLKYVHQLMTLYFSLTGKELTVNL